MIIDGKKIAERIKNSLKNEIEESGKKLKLAIVQVGDNLISKKFIEKKVEFAESIGVGTRIYNFPAEISTNQMRKKMAEICHIRENDGVILQLPLPEQINTRYILNSIPFKKDVDVLSSRAFGNFATQHSKILPPVVAAVKEILNNYLLPTTNYSLKGKNVVVIGAGILVGKPCAVWTTNEGATVSVINEYTLNLGAYALMADIVISGAGKPDLIKPDMVKDGVVIIDAGISSQPIANSGQIKLVGDVDATVAEKTSLFTPVPGGVGPITVAMVFRNLVELSKSR